MNSTSWASIAVANQFIRLREIPTVNVVYVEWNGGISEVDSATFIGKIFSPIIEAIERRKLTGQIDAVVYSADFPTAVNLSKDYGELKLPNQATPVASLNSATYFWPLVLTKRPQILEFSANHYSRQARDRALLSTQGFRSWYGWGLDGQLYEAGGQPYMLSMLLGVTSGRGNSVREVFEYLVSAASADGTQPKGTIYFSKTDDVRSKARDETTRTPRGEFNEAVAELQKLGVRAQVIKTVVPENRRDVQGLQTGTPSFSWANSKSKILPGAICENFTSFGGIMTEGAGQTPLTELLRYGAAGSSGTVVEPYSIFQKFPSPQVQVHYARGATLIEAYYQSVASPAQLLIVGDPLCRPWADIPEVTIDGLEDGQTVSGVVELLPKAKLPSDGSVDRFELFVDGRRTVTAKPGEKLAWDSATDADGYHELRVVAVASNALETQGRKSLQVKSNNNGRTSQMATSPAQAARWDEQWRIAVRSPGARETIVHSSGRELGKIQGEQGVLEVNPRRLGFGPVTLYAVSSAGAGIANRVNAVPLNLMIEPNAPLPALTNVPPGLQPGLVVRAGGRGSVIDKTNDPNWTNRAGIELGQPFDVDGYFDAPTADVYQFQLWYHGNVLLSVDGRSIHNAAGEGSWQYVPINLAAGKHRVTVAGRLTDLKLQILFGGPGAVSLSGTMFKHPR